MIVSINFEVFHLRYFKQNTIFVKENEDSWELFTQDGIVIIYCKQEKFSESERNFAFVDKYLGSPTVNVLKVDDFGFEYKDLMIPQKQEDVDENIPVPEENVPISEGTTDYDKKVNKIIESLDEPDAGDEE